MPFFLHLSVDIERGLASTSIHTQSNEGTARWRACPDYNYANVADLRVLIQPDGVSWQGISGPLKDMRGGGSGLRLSKVAEGIYFGTWVSEFGGEDSITTPMSQEERIAIRLRNNAR